MSKGNVSKAEVEAKVAEVLQMKLDGYSTAQIKELTKHWKLSDRSLNNYISRATEKLTAINLSTAEENRAFVLSNLTRLFREAKLDLDKKEQHRILNSIGKYAGLDKISINVSKGDERILKDLSNEDLQSLVKEDNEDIS